jgi:hypothetical protein
MPNQRLAQNQFVSVRANAAISGYERLRFTAFESGNFRSPNIASTIKDFNLLTDSGTSHRKMAMFLVAYRYEVIFDDGI